ncbi:MAG: hypothetical protein M3Z27_07560 [Actinomycetota bacterium]|nr:hypothetical protein [Actinomycetota bacterium]
MSYSSADARVQLLEELHRAAEGIGSAVAALGEAYEWLDDQSADRLEEELFRPAQAAFGRAQRTHLEFAGRHGLPAAAFSAPSLGGRPGDARGAIERAAGALAGADQTLATLQDSMLPVDVGDPELRAGLSNVREVISPLPARTRGLLRLLGR